MSRTKIRPDDDDILEKLRVKRSVSIPILDLEEDNGLVEDSSDTTIEAKQEPTVADSPSIAPKVASKKEVVKPTPVVNNTPPPAQATPAPEPVVANIKTAPQGAPKLFVSGRLPRKKGTSSRSLQLLHSIEEEMKQYCSGGDLVVLNYLIKLGLEKVKESHDLIIIDSDTL